MNTQTSCDRVGSELIYILLTAGGENPTTSLNTLSTSNKIIPWDKKRSDTCVVPGNLLKQRGSLERQLAYLQRLAASLKLIFCLLSIKGLVLYCKVRISIDFANKVAKIWPKSNSLVTYEFLGQNTGLHVCNTKENRFAKHSCA